MARGRDVGGLNAAALAGDLQRIKTECAERMYCT